MPGYHHTLSGSYPEGRRFRLERRSTPCCPRCGSPEFNGADRTGDGRPYVRCADCGELTGLDDFEYLYESDFEIQEA